jgi:hypothetical protein
MNDYLKKQILGEYRIMLTVFTANAGKGRM